MNILRLSHPSKKVIGKIRVPGSKSESNRALLLKQLYFSNLHIDGLSDSRDTESMQNGLAFKGDHLNIGDAGTAMRFLTAFYAAQPQTEILISGTSRMHQRPIAVLVKALRELGARIDYAGEEGFPPLRISGQSLVGGKLEIDGSISSQFISALMMLGPQMEEGLELHIKGFSVSAPYIYLTANLMRRMNFDVGIVGEQISIRPKKDIQLKQFAIEPDWSSASYWFLIALLAEKAEIYLPGFRQYSLQGDAFVSGLFDPLGVESHFIGSGFRLKKSHLKQKQYTINLVHNPDLAQTLAVAFVAKGVQARISGLQTLRIKETNRLEALKKELEKTGAEISIGDDFLEISKGVQQLKDVVFQTYDDHRMAMALAPLALLAPISIENPGVVAKSYQSFWSDLEKVGFQTI